MLLVCPSCASTYNISSEKLGKGRTVRCKHCQACWYAAAPDAFDAAVAPIIAAADEETLAARARLEADEASAAPAPVAEAPADIPLHLAIDSPADSESAEVARDGEASAEVARDGDALLRNMTDLDHGPRESSDLDGEVVAVSARPVEVNPMDRPGQADVKRHPPGRLAALLRALPRLIAPRPGIGAATNIPAPSSPVLQTAPPSRPARPPAAARRLRLAAALPYGAFAASCLLVAGLAARGPIMSAAPGTGRLYAALGLADESSSVAIISVRSEIGAADGGDVLLVEGELASRARAPVNVPGIRVVVRDEQGVELYAWPAQSLKLTLQPGERTVFRARLAAPPPTGKTVQVRFETG